MATAMDVSCDSGDRESAMAFAMELRRATAALQASIDAARSTDHVSLPAGGPTTASDVVDYARRISYTTYAPAGYEPGAPLHGIMPPAPQEEHFGASHLARHAAEVRAREEARRARAVVADEARRAAVAGATPPLETVIKLLSNWKPGQPWPAGIPPPPLGWKPGDPLTIEGAPKTTAETTAPAADVAPMPKPPRVATAPPKRPTKVVPFVQLDLNPDMDDLSDEFEEVSGSDNSDDSDDD